MPRSSIKNIYEGIDLVYYGNGRQLEYDFVIRPEASADRIRLGFSHVQDLRIDGDGNLVIAPVAPRYDDVQGAGMFPKDSGYQKDGQRRLRLDGEKGSGPSLGSGFFRWVPMTQNIPWSSTRSFSMPPASAAAVMTWGSPLPWTSAKPYSDRAFITGYTISATGDFPGTGVGDPNTGFQVTQNVFVAKLNAAGDALEYGTYIGGVAGYNGATNL